LKKELFNRISREAGYLALIFLSFTIILKIAFFRENFLSVLRTSASLFWIFALPGYFIMGYWSSRIGFMERLVIGIIVAAGITGIMSYYLGLIGLHIKYHSVLLPILLIAVGFYSEYRKN